MRLNRQPRLQLLFARWAARQEPSVLDRKYAVGSSPDLGILASRKKTLESDESRVVNSPNIGSFHNTNTSYRRLRIDSTKGVPSVETPRPASPRPNLSLFEELFPEERKPVATPSKDDNELKPLSLDSSFVWSKPHLRTRQPLGENDSSANGTDTRKSGSKIIPDTTIDYLKRQERHHASVLVLSNAGKSLTESDFTRLSPEGEHIGGWKSGLIQVIPGRDPVTLEHLGHYFILFSGSAAARAYQDQVIHLHRLSRIYARRTETSLLPPPPFFLKDGEDIHALMQSFTLIPPSHGKVSIRMLERPCSQTVERIIYNGGHPRLTGLPAKIGDSVLFSLDHGYLSVRDLHNFLGKDGISRNLQWKTLPGKDGIVRLNGLMDEDEAGLMEGSGKGQAELQRPDGLRNKWGPPRFIISFQEHQEARRFVRDWHRQPFPLQDSRNELPPIVNVELLW